MVVKKEIRLSGNEVARLIESHLRDKLNDKSIILDASNVSAGMRHGTSHPDLYNIRWEQKVDD